MSEFTDGARDTRMIERALREGWDIPDTVMQEIPLRLLKIIRENDKSPRNQIAASRVLASLHGQNLEVALKTLPTKVNVNHSGNVQVYIPDNQRLDPPERQSLTNGNGHTNGNGTHDL